MTKILDDLEFVAANLNGSDERVPAIQEQLIDIAYHKTEATKAKDDAKKAKDDNVVLKRNFYKLEKKVETLEETDKHKDAKIKELKSVITRLTNNSNNMLGVLSAKADIEDKLKGAEKSLNLAQQQLAAEKFKNSQLDLKCKSTEFRTSELMKIIQ